MTPRTSPSNSLKWSFSTLGCPELSLSEVVDLAKKFGLELLELRTLSHRLDLPTLLTEQFGDPITLRRWLQERSVRITALDSSAKLMGCPPELKAELLQLAHWAHGLGVPGIRVFDGGPFHSELQADDLAEAVEFLKAWEHERAKNGWNTALMIETHDALCTAKNCLALARALERSGIRMHLLWDAHHTWQKGGEDPLITWPQIQSYVRHIHVKDSLDHPSARHPFTYTHLGSGRFALRALIDQLTQDGFAGVVSLEWERQWHPYLEPLELALERLQDYR